MNLTKSIGLNLIFPTVLAMTTIAERLQKALDLRGREPPSLIQALGVSKGTIYNILGGTTRAEKVWASTAIGICRELGIGLQWFVTGKGPMETNVAPQDDGEWGEILGYAQAAGLGKGAEAQEYAETHKLKFRADSLARKRLSPSKLAVYYGDGDSMEPRINTGDAILFDQSDTRPRDGAIFVVLWKGEVYAKRCEILEDVAYFRSDNPGGDHQWVKPKRMDAKRDPITILGRVRWIGSWED